MYILLEKHNTQYLFIDKGELARLYRLWLDNPTERIIVKQINVEVDEA